jgi:hypothetical protein
MNVAVLINGTYHPYLRRDLLEENLVRNEEILGQFDFYYQTWDNDLCRHIFKDLNREILWSQEPEMTEYDPYKLALQELQFKTKRFRRIVHSPPKFVGNYGCHQHMALERQIQTLPKKYDYYIRLRWDSYLNKNLPIKELIEIANENVVGIGAIPNHPSIAMKKMNTMGSGDKNKTGYKSVKVKRNNLRNHIDQGFYCYLNGPNQHEDPDFLVWENFLSDFMIIFKQEDLDGFKIEDTYKEKRLYAAEFGWYQIFCRNRSHVNLDGLVSILRNVDDSHEAYLKLIRSGML